MLAVGMEVASGDTNAVAVAITNLIAFKNRHIEKLKNDNKALAEGILECKNRNKLNAGIRKLAAVTAYISVRCGMSYIRIFNISMASV